MIFQELLSGSPLAKDIFQNLVLAVLYVIKIQLLRFSLSSAVDLQSVNQTVSKTFINKYLHKLFAIKCIAFLYLCPPLSPSLHCQKCTRIFELKFAEIQIAICLFCFSCPLGVYKIQFFFSKRVHISRAGCLVPGCCISNNFH